MYQKLVFSALTALSFAVAHAAAPQNVILFIGDGMGPEQVKAAHYYHGGDLSFESLVNFPHQAWCTTASADSSVTDSAAAATAIATGVKVNNGVISLKTPGDGSELETMLELFKKRGKATGLITTAYLTHATPAGFGAHDPNRNNTAAIGNDLLTQSQPNILFGGGENGLDPVSAASYGYQVATDTTGFKLLDTSRTSYDHLCALFGSGYMPYEEDYLTAQEPYPYPHLSELVATALDALEENPGGFFLMVEAGRIDHAGHSNLLPEAVHETLELSRAVDAALLWASGRSDTLILVTADHETGGLTVTKDNGLNTYPSASWSTTGHTGVNVPVYAVGPNAELVTGTLDNTDFLRVVTLEDPAAPRLYRVSVQDMAGTSATVVWNTDNPSDSTVEYSKLGTPDTWTVVTDATLTTTHRVPLTGLAVGQTYEYRVTSNDGSTSGSSAIHSFQTFYNPDAPITLVGAGSTWKYLADGSNQGTAWRSPDYDDSQWPSGPAQLGYGDGDEITLLPKTPVYATYYFRHTFTVADPSLYGALTLDLLYDDGAIVYLNGTEIYRVNMPSGEVAYDRFASTANEYSWTGPISVPSGLLVSGENVLAVEVHQANATSSDVSLDLALTAPDPNNVQIVKGPWLQNVTPDSIVVMWETDGPAGSRVDYGVGGSDESQITDDTAVTIHEITLAGLDPNTTYAYTVASGYAVSAEASFTTALNAGSTETFRFAVYSDTQTYALNHAAVIDSILWNDPLPRFILHAGDLVENGLDYADWGSQFFAPAAPMLSRIPVFPALGNHEYAGSGPPWFFDFFSLPANGTPQGAEEWYAFTYGSARFIALNSNAPYDPGSAQYAWLSSELVSQEFLDAAWRIVYFHHPVYSDSPTLDIQTGLVPLFHLHGVHLVFSGHNHNYRHVLRTDPDNASQVDYLITGGGGATPVNPGPLPADTSLTQLAAEAALHHCVLDVSPSHLTLTAYRNDGTVIETFGLVRGDDTTDPVITAGPTIVTADTSATVTWTTDEPADSLVEYWPSASPEVHVTVDEPTHVTSHSVLLSDLSPLTEYTFQVTSADATGNDVTSDPYLFTTLKSNHAPTTSGQEVVCDEDISVVITLIATDADGDPLGYTITAGPSYGSLDTTKLTATPPQVTYTPSLNWNGIDAFDYTVSDGALSATATVTITVRAIDDPVEAPTDLQALEGDGVVTLNWLPSDDPDGDSLVYTVYRDGDLLKAGLSATTYSDTTVSNDTEYEYFVRVSDGSSTADSAPVFATPRKIDPNAYVIADPTMITGSLGGSAFDTLAPEGGGAQTLTETKVGTFGRLEAQYVLQTVVDPATITTVVLHLAGALDAGTDDAPWPLSVWRSGAWAPLGDVTSVTFELDPATDVGADGTIQIAITDGADGKKEAYDTFTLNTLYAEIEAGPPNAPPTSASQSVTVNEDIALVITLTARDADGDPLGYTITAGPSNGSLDTAELTATPPQVTYTPDPDWNGTDTFTFVADDGRATSADATVTITVSPVNDAPTADDLSASTTPGTLVAVTLAGSDPDGDTLTYAITAGPSNGSAAILDNVVTYTPNAGTTTDTFEYTVSDGTLSATATVTINVSANQPPVITLATDAPSYTAPATIVLTATASDVDGTITGVEFFQIGSGSDTWLGVVEGAAESYTWTLNGVEAGTYDFKAVATDNNGATTPSDAVSVTVNDAPQITFTSTLLEPSRTGKNWKGVVAITVLDGGAPLVGATVTGEWFFEGASIGTSTGTTDASGVAVLTSSPVKTDTGAGFSVEILSIVPAP